MFGLEYLLLFGLPENKLEDLKGSNKKSQPITLEIVEDGVLRPTYSIVTGQKLVFRKVK